MLPIATKLLTQRLKEVDAEIARVTLLKPVSAYARIWQRDINQLKAIRREVTRELDVLDTL